MPAQSLKKVWDKITTTDITEKINVIAREFLVSSLALKYRLRNLQMITDGDILRIDDSRLKWTETEQKPPLYSEKFAKMLHKLLNKGRLSVRRAAGLLDCGIDDLKDLFHSYNMETPFDL
jgi:Zn-dependent peptidase ImmA (M78 family)